MSQCTYTQYNNNKINTHTEKYSLLGKGTWILENLSLDQDRVVGA
jgi:hypothetical protein